MTAENVAELSERFQPELIDLSSGVEDEIGGIKNHEKIKKIVTSLRLQ